MRFKHKDTLGYEIGDIKFKTKFLWLPTRIKNETRWLEFARIEYHYTEYLESLDYGGIMGTKWIPVRWVFHDPVKDCPVYKTDKCAHVDGPLCNSNCNEYLDHYEDSN